MGRCGVCNRGYAKVGTRCFTCFKSHIQKLMGDPPRCGICQRGFAKIGMRCFTCYRTVALQSGRKVIIKGAHDAEPLPHDAEPPSLKRPRDEDCEERRTQKRCLV